VSLKLSGDRKTHTRVKDRLVWFEGDDMLAEAAEKWQQPNLVGPLRFQQDAMKLGPIKVYVVYAEADSNDAERLLGLLRPWFQISNIEIWSHKDILPGQNREKEKQKQRENCDLTIQLISPEFEAAGLSTERGARFVPVSLHEVGHEFEDVEIFRHGSRAFDETRSRRAFAHSLFQKIEAALRQRDEGLEDLQRLAHQSEKVVDRLAAPVSLLRDVVVEQERLTNRCDAITFLDEWLFDAKAPVFCALLGELGMGKTTTAKEFARRLWERRGKGEQVPAAIYLDLRSVGDAAVKDPDLDEIVERILKRDWKGGPRTVPPQPREIYSLVEQGAVAIFDGLDEVLVHLTPTQGQAFTRQLFRILPAGSKRGRLLITCRTHYFRTVQEQSAHFRMEDRDEVSAEHYRALVLLPFEEEQIRTYLKNSLPEQDADQVYEFLQSVHNLPELAERPLTLNLITRQVKTAGGMEGAGRDGYGADALPVCSGGMAAAGWGEASVQS